LKRKRRPLAGSMRDPIATMKELYHEGVGTDDPSLCVSAASGIGRLLARHECWAGEIPGAGRSGVVALLLKWLQEGDAEVRLTCVEALGCAENWTVQEQAALKHAALKDAEVEVREAAALALEQLGSDDETLTMGVVQLRPLVTEEPAPGMDMFDALEEARTTLSLDDASWMVEAMLSDWGRPAAPSFSSQAAATFSPNPAAVRLGEPLRRFCMRMLDAVQLQLRERVQPLWRSLEASTHTAQLKLQLAVRLTVTRKAADDAFVDEIIHADAFDGTVLSLAFVSSKMGTRLFPDAVFVQPPVEQFIAESKSGRRNGFSRVVECAHGGMRVLHPGLLAILPPAMAHARPEGRVDAHPPLGPRWFARAHLELRPSGGRTAWDCAQRISTALLVAEHVWQDEGFLAAVNQELGKEL
jgi:hypothetical protein